MILDVKKITYKNLELVVSLSVKNQAIIVGVRTPALKKIEVEHFVKEIETNLKIRQMFNYWYIDNSEYFLSKLINCYYHRQLEEDIDKIFMSFLHAAFPGYKK